MVTFAASPAEASAAAASGWQASGYPITGLCLLMSQASSVLRWQGRLWAEGAALLHHAPSRRLSEPRPLQGPPIEAELSDAPAGHMYAVHPIPLSEIRAICKHTPSFGWQYIIVVLGNGLTLPPLYFSTGGVKGLMSALKQVSCPHGHAGHEQSSCSPQGAATRCRWGERCDR